MKKTIKYLQDGEYHYATVKDVGDLEQLKTKHKEDLVTALNELFTTGGEAKPAGYDDLVKKVNDTQTNLNGINGEVSNVKDKVDNLQISGRNYIQNSESITMTPNGTDNYDLVWYVYNDAFASNTYCHGNNKTRFSFYLTPSKALPTARTFRIYWRAAPWNSFGTITVPANTTDTQYYELTMTTPTSQPIASQIFIRFMAQDTSDISYTITKSMLTIGDSFPDWQPAPEDTNSAIETVSSKIDQTADGINNTITDINGKVVANDEAIVQAKKDLQDALTQFQTFNDEIEQAKKDAETKLADAKQALKDEFNNNLADAQKANQKQLEDKIAVIQGNLDTTSNTLNDVKTQLTNAKLDYGNVNVSIQKLNDMLSTKLSSTDLDPLRTSIQNQESEIQQTKDSLATKAGKAELDVLSGRVSNTEAKIKQQADEISLGVKKSELNGAIDNYQVEGTNRLRDTIDFDIDNGYWKLDQYSINSNTDVHPYDQAHDISALVLQKTGSAKQDVDFTNEDLGNSFVISVWNKKDAQPQVWYGNTQLTNRQVSDIKGDYERSFFTFIPTNVNVKTIMFKYDAGTVDQLVIGEPKLELGTKPKAYAPNPNDEHKQIVNTKAELKIASDKIESTVEKQTKTDDNINQLSSRVTQTEQGITATNDLITKTKDGLIKDYTGKIDASAKSLSSEFDEKTDEKIGQITDSGENLILNSAFTNETDRKDKWQNISDKVNIVDDGNGLMWAKMSQSGLTSDNPISLTSNYFPIKQGKITVGVDIKSDNTNGLSGAKILVLQTYNANKQRVDFTELTLENMGLTVQQLADGQSHRGVYRLGNDRSDAVYMTVKAVLPRNGSIYFTNFSAKLSSIDNGGYTPNADDLKRQILNQKTKIEQNSQQITLKASSTELRDVRTIANGAVSSATNANNNASSAMNTANTANSNANQANSKITEIQSNGGGRNLLHGTRDFKQWGTSISKVAVTNSGETFQAATGTASSSQNYFDLVTFNSILLEKDTDYTASFWVKTSENTEIWSYLFDSGNNGTYSDGGAKSQSTTNYTRVVVHFHNGNNNTTLKFIPVRIKKKSTITVWLYGCMLEKGTVAHEWQPAPEDIQSQIDQARTDIQSTLTVANNGITAATNLKTTYDNYVQKNDANIKLLGDRITNEVSKITSNGGGRNLWIDSKSFQHTITNHPKVDFGTDSDGITTAHITGAGGFYGQWQNIYANSTEPFAIGDSETFSVEMKGTGTITIGREHDFEKAVTLTNTWTRYSVSGEAKSANRAHIMYNESGKDCDAYVRLPMVEKGVIAHEWQPAPEDTSSQIEAVSSKIDQTATSITSTVSSAKQDLQGQIDSTNTKITQTANSITEQLKSYSKTGDMQNYVNTTIQKTADGINTKVSGVESRVDEANTKIDKTATNLTSTVNSTKQDLQGKIDSTKQDLQGQITQTANDINGKVSGVENKVNGIKIGGRNLLQAGGLRLGYNHTTGNYDATNDIYYITQPSNASDIGSWGAGVEIKDDTSPNSNVRNVVVPYGQTYCASMEVWSPVAMHMQVDVNNFPVTGNAWAGNDNDNVSLRGTQYFDIPANVWTKIYWTATNSNPSNTDKVDLIVYDGIGSTAPVGTSWRIRHPKVELGNIPTDWSPSPEDVQAQINANKTSANNAQSTANSAQNTANQANSNANSAVNTANSANSTANNAVNTATQAKNNANSAVNTANTANNTANSAKSTADSANTNANSALTKANNAVDTANSANNNAAQAVTTANTANNKVDAIQANGGGRNLIANTGTDIVIDATSANASNWCFYVFYFTEQPKQGDLITVSAEGTLTGTGTLSEYEVILFDTSTLNPRSQAQYLKAGERDSVTLSLDNLDGSGNTILLIYAGKGGETKGKKNVVHHLMVEKGTVAHDWQPSPEDTDAKITTNSTAIDQNKKAIALKADQTTVDKTNGDVQQLQSQLKVQADQIAAKVSSTDFTALNERAMQNRGTVNAPDFNSLTQAGYYTITRPGQGNNYPDGSWGTLEVSGQVADDTGRLNQKYVSDNNGTVYTRQYNNNTKGWTAWVKEANQNDVDSAIQTTKADLVQQITDAKNAAIKVSKDSITSEVSDVRTTITQVDNKVSSVDGKVDSTKQDLQGKIDSANTKIDQTTTNINDKVSGVENKVDSANNKIDNLQIGGRNLLTGSKTMHDVWTADGTSIFSADGYLGVRAIDNNMRIYQNPSEDTNGKLMSVSFDAEVPADSKNQSVQIWVGPFQAGVSVTISGNDFKRYKVESWKWNSANKAFSIQFKNANDKINIKKIKLEFGNKATDWSPAPEDTQTQIDANKTAANNAQNTANNANTTANSALTKANSAVTTANSANTTANQANSTASSVVSVANNANTNATSANTTANSANSNATSAVSVANSALTKADSAVSVANNANTNATSAVNTASQANATANSAKGTANTASNTASSAVSVASQAVNTANSANTTASNAANTANTANNNATSAVSVANSAKSTADSANTNANNAVNTANQAVDTANSVDSKITDIQANGGGRNLLRNSIGKFQPNLSRTDNYAVYADSTVYMEQEQQYTVHADASDGLVWSSIHDCSYENNHVVLWLVDNKSVYQIVSDANTGTGTTFTWNHPSGTYDLRVNTYKADNSGYVEKVMLEKGIVAHEWQPAPEDIATDISNVNTKVEQYKTKIDQNEKAIALKADQTTVDKTNGAVQQLQTQLKVQSDQISSKVSSSDLDARGYATQAYTQTQIQQTADSINSTINNNQKNAESRFQQTDAKLSATVTKDQLQAGFNIADGKIDLMGKKLALTGDMIASGGPYKHNHVGYMGQRSGGWQSSENWQIDGERFNFTSDDIPIAGNRFVYSRFLIDEILGLKTYTSNADERMNGPYVTDRFLERKGNHVYDFINRKDVPDDAPENAGAIKITALGAGDISNNYIGLKYMFLDMSKHFVDTTKVLVPKDNALYMKQGGKKLYGEQYMIAGVNAEAGTEIKNWYYFDKNDRDGAAAMDKFVTLPDGRVVHYDSNGIMDHGEFMVGTDYYYADLADGEIRKNAIGLVQETHQLHYYGADGKRQTGNITIKNRQYTFDANTGALTSSTKGEFQIGDDYYCLVIPYLGYIATGWYMLDDGRYVYYDPTTGAMVHGKHKIDGHTYNFTNDGSVLDEDRLGNYTADKKGLDFASLTSTDAPYYDNDLIDASDQNKYVYTYGKNIDNQYDVDPNRLYWAFKNGGLSKADMIPNQKYLMEFEWWMSGDAEYYGTFYPQLSDYPWQLNNKDIDWPVRISKQNNGGIYKRIISDGRDFSKVSNVKATGMVMRLDHVIGKLNVRNFHIIPLDTGMENKDATISFYARSLNGSVKLHVQDATSDVVTLTNQWQRYQVHLKCKDNASTVKFYLENSGIFEISMPKYELGTLATPWVDNGVGALAQKRESSISPFDGIVSKWSNATGEDTTQVSLRPDTGLIATDVNNQFIYAKPNKAQLLPNSLNLISGLADRSMKYTSEGFTYTGRDGKNLIFSIPYLHSITDVDTQYGTIYDFVASQNNRVNLIRNSNFSSAQDGWNMGSGCWVTTDDFVNGAPYLQISIDTNTNGYAWQETKWVPATGQTLMVSVKVRKDIAHHIDDANAGVLLDFGNGGSIFLNPNWDSVKFGRWTQLAWGPISVPANANYFHPNLYLRNEGGKGWARICFSEFCVYPGIDVRPYSKG